MAFGGPLSLFKLHPSTVNEYRGWVKLLSVKIRIEWISVWCAVPLEKSPAFPADGRITLASSSRLVPRSPSTSPREPPGTPRKPWDPDPSRDSRASQLGIRSSGISERTWETPRCWVRASTVAIAVRIISTFNSKVLFYPEPNQLHSIPLFLKQCLWRRCGQSTLVTTKTQKVSVFG